MAIVVGIGFKEVGKLYYFDPTPYTFKEEDLVVVETVRGIELGKVIVANKDMEEAALEHELKRVMRPATLEDLRAYEGNKEKAKYTLEICKDIVRYHELDMKLLDCEYTLDKSKVIIYYNAEGRIDFRELLKDLAAELRVRIELRQIGPREGAKFVGGLASCGRVICCAKHLREFDLVTMKMAKDQGMTLNSSKIAGLCGKLMCCIGYENEVYQELKERVPAVGEIVKTPTCESCRVVAVDLLQEIVRTANKAEDKVEVWHSSEVTRFNIKKEEIRPQDLTDDVIEDDFNS